MKLSKHDKQLIHNYGIKTTNNRRNDFFKTIEFLSWSFFSNASFFCEKENKSVAKAYKDNITEIIEFYKNNNLDTIETNKSFLHAIYPINNNLFENYINLYVNDYVVKLSFLYSLGFENDFYWEQIEKELYNIGYEMNNTYNCSTSHNFLTNMKHLYNNLKNDSIQISIVNKCILNIYYTYSKYKLPQINFSSFSFCDVLVQLKSYKDIFRSTSLLEEKLFNNMQRRINRDIINMKIKGTWTARNK